MRGQRSEARVCMYTCNRDNVYNICADSFSPLTTFADLDHASLMTRLCVLQRDKHVWSLRGRPKFTDSETPRVDNDIVTQFEGAVAPH
uniref:Uncharacterized protein n=1 Tax=Trichogramma kaykai TaxID=54128 RepID=A0ABD2XM32_9HYME